MGRRVVAPQGAEAHLPGAHGGDGEGHVVHRHEQQHLPRTPPTSTPMPQPSPIQGLVSTNALAPAPAPGPSPATRLPAPPHFLASQSPSTGKRRRSADRTSAGRIRAHCTPQMRRIRGRAGAGDIQSTSTGTGRRLPVSDAPGIRGRGDRAGASPARKRRRRSPRRCRPAGACPSCPPASAALPCAALLVRIGQAAEWLEIRGQAPPFPDRRPPPRGHLSETPKERATGG